MQRSLSPRLDVTMAGVQFRSPFGVAPLGSHFGKSLYNDPQLYAEITAEILAKHIKAGAGFIYVVGAFLSDETIRKLEEVSRPEEKQQRPFTGIHSRIMTAGKPITPDSKEGLFCIASPFRLDAKIAKRAEKALENLMKLLKQQTPEDVPIVANVIGDGGLADSYVDGAKRWEELGASLVELNLSCPWPSGLKNAVDNYFQRKFPAYFQGMLLGDNLDLAEEITRQVVKSVKIPVGVKISPETGFPRVVELAKRLKDAGAKYIETFNSAVGIAPPDIYNRGKPLWPFMEGNPFCMSSGSWLRFPCYRNVAAIARFVPGLEIAAAGGLTKPEHCVEMMMLGASLTEFCTGVIEQGRDLIKRNNDFMKKFMEEQGYDNVRDLIGIGQQYIKYNEELVIEDNIISELDENKCIRCGRCINGMCIALFSDHGKIKIRTDRCHGCGACVVACPVGALKLVRMG